MSSMRQAQEFLREQIAAELPLRVKKGAELPLMFAGEQRRDPLCGGAAAARAGRRRLLLPARRRASDGDKSQLVLERTIPDPAATQNPEFRDAEHSVLADGIAELRDLAISAATRMPPTPTRRRWRDRWDDSQRLPLLVRIDVKPVKGPAWPTLVVEPRRAPEAGCASYDPVRNRCVGTG